MATDYQCGGQPVDPWPSSGWILLSPYAPVFCLNNQMVRAWRIFAWALAWAGTLAIPARAGQETFDNTGLTNAWVAAGTFTGQESIVWTYANARGYPTVYATNPSITLRGDNLATNKGWLQSATFTGGVQTVSAAFKQEGALAVDCDIWVGGAKIGNYKSAGVSGTVEVASFEAYDSTNHVPFTNQFTLTLSNRVTGTGRVGIDDLTWSPFRLYVQVEAIETNAYVSQDFNIHATVFTAGQEVAGGWSIAPAFSGAGLEDPSQLDLTLVPALADTGKVFTLTYTATDAEAGGFTNQASCQFAVLDDPWRFIDFETADFNYNTNGGVETNLNGMRWCFTNVMTSESDDRRIGTTSARFRHSSAELPASMESVDSFAGIGTVSLHYAYYGSNRTVTFELQVQGDGEEWTTVSNGTFNVRDHDDITNSVFSVDVLRADDVRLKLVTTGNADQIANIDDIQIRKVTDVLPRLECSGERVAPVGRETVLDFTLVNADFIPRAWEYSILRDNPNAVFTNVDDQLQLRFAPVDTNEWGDYTVAVTARIDNAVVGTTSLVIRVVSPPVFDLAPVATNIVIPTRVDVWVTNVLLHGTGTEWSTEWNDIPPFATRPTTSNKSRFLINTNTTLADVGAHTLTAVMTDSETGIQTTNSVVITVTSGGGGETNEVYPILTYTLTNLVVSGKAARVFLPFGLTNLDRGADPTNWSWQGTAYTNTDGSNVVLELPADPGTDHYFFGVRIAPAP